MPSVLRFPANQEKDPTDLPESPEELFEPPPDLVAPSGARSTRLVRPSSATIVPEASFDEPTRPSHHPGPDLDEAPWFENTAPSAPPVKDDFDDGFVRSQRRYRRAPERRGGGARRRTKHRAPACRSCSQRPA